MHTESDRRDLALALLLFRYVGHKISSNGTPSNDADARQARALRLAKGLGVKDEYLAAVFRVPVSSVTVKGLEPWDGSESAKRPRSRRPRRTAASLR